jgi:hypothetical protein
MRRSSQSILLTTLMSSVFAPLITMGAANAGGGFLEPKTDVVAVYSTGHQPATASDAVTLELSGNGATVLATSGANAQSGIGSAASAAWSTTTVTGSGNTQIIESSTALSTGFSKGPNSITKAMSATETTVVINGQTYAVAKEVAMAVARNTGFGSSAAVGIEASVSGGAESTIQVASSKPLSR